MEQESQSFISRYKLPLLVAAVILVLGILAAIIFGLILPGLRNSEPQGQSNPSLVDTTTDESATIEMLFGIERFTDGFDR